jgi:hypothetical protein
MGNCYTTLAFFELRHGENPDSVVEVAEKQFQESVRLKPSGQVLSDHIWALGVRAQAQVLRGQDPTATLQAASELFEESQRHTPDYFFAQTNLADIVVLRAEFMVDHGQDPGRELDRVEELARTVMKKKTGFVYALPNLGKASLLRARWKVNKKLDPSSDLASARNYFERGRREKPDQIWPQQGLLACRLEQLKSRGVWDQAAFLRLLSEAKKLLLIHPKDPRIQALVARIQDFGVGHLIPTT